MTEFRAAVTIAIGCMVVAILSLYYATGVGDAAMQLWRQL